ncbi:hypothetical protein SAY86_004443 [Trapa natans]|uniref:EF-hand domain-containing protein n=1 Tax=Trapa natans TaxID=22666 RepID=A0AAN7MIJ9_TRANT|nr:hypothetical protein SAY86_004443 [Trapa natans]
MTTANGIYMAAACPDPNFLDFEDYFPSMMVRLGAEGFIGELCSGFQLLMDSEKGLITFNSLKRNIHVLGLEDVLGDDVIVCMLLEGDLDGDGMLNQMEFCILMLRLSPGLTMDGTTACCSSMAQATGNHLI